MVWGLGRCIAAALRAHGRAVIRIAILLPVLVASVSLSGIARTDATSATFTNPLLIEPTAAGPFESCPDPAIIRGQEPGDLLWYLYCTTNPLNGADRTTSGRLNVHLLPMLQSRDLVHWMYVGDAFTERPTWVAPFGSLWAPDIQFFSGRYYLYYTANITTLPERGSAIGVATSLSPTGPWTDSGAPVVEPQMMPGSGNARRWVYDPAVVSDDTGQRYLFYGSFVGGITARRLSADGLHTDPASETPIAAANRYEGAAVWRHDGFWYLFASAGECCNGALSGYGVFVGRATSILGPYTDRDGVSLLADAVGGTPVLSANGNRWIGPGHNTVFTDRAGQDWVLYHAIDRGDPYFDGTTTTKRPALLDPLDWVDGWPVIRGGLGPSETPQHAPAAQPGDPPRTQLEPVEDDPLGTLDGTRSVDFAALPASGAGATPTFPAGAWRWTGAPDTPLPTVSEGTLRLTAPADARDQSAAALLSVAPPTGDYTVETRVRLDLPPGGCCQTPTRAGLVIYGDDANTISLTQVARGPMRQVLFTKTTATAPPRQPREGNAAVGAPDTWTYLRIARQMRGGEERYTAYSSRDGTHWVRGSTWTAALGQDARIGLVARGDTGLTASFEYVRVFIPPPR
jgi:arabinan endo-1,5-alpha-L-arabinosidase